MKETDICDTVLETERLSSIDNLSSSEQSMRSVNWIIIVCILSSQLVWYTSLYEKDLMLGYLAFSRDSVLQGRVWTPVTALFLHNDLLHLGGNMIFLYVFGNTLEKEVKSTKTLVAFFTGGILSFFLSSFFYDPGTPMIGASAAIFTLASAVMLVKPLKFSLFFLMPLGLVAVIYLVYNVVAVYSNVQDNVAYISHVIGFVVGVPFGLSWSTDWKRNLLIAIGFLILYCILQIYLIPIVLKNIQLPLPF